jgi:hypothetical protein
MTMYETTDLHKRVERYEAALDELRAAHQDVKNILHDQVLYDRWQQIGTDLGFTAGAAQYQQAGAQSPVAGIQHDLNGHQIPQMAESWAS